MIIKPFSPIDFRGSRIPRTITLWCLLFTLALSLAGCGVSETTDESNYVASQRFSVALPFDLTANISAVRFEVTNDDGATHAHGELALCVLPRGRSIRGGRRLFRGDALTQFSTRATTALWLAVQRCLDHACEPEEYQPIPVHPRP